MRKIIFLLFLILSTFYGQSKSIKIDDLLSRYYDYGLLNASVLVAENGEIIYSEGYGYANIEFDIKNSPNTVHRIGSITKQFVATMIMQFVEENIIDLDEKMTTYLKNYRKDTGDKVTIHHLLTHTSGIPSYTGYPGFWTDSSRNPYTTDELISKFCEGDLEFEPGSEFKYNNSGYVLLAKIIEEVTGKSYEENIQERIFDKIGMSNTYLDRPSKIIKNRAAGYDKNGGEYVNTRYMDVKNAFGAGDIASTVEDLFLWDQALYDESILTEISKEKMFTPFLSSYGYGWGISKMENPAGGDSLTMYSHTGGINGFNSLISRIINDKNLIVILNNTGGAPLGDIRNNIIKILYGKDYDYPKKPISTHLHEIINESGIDKAVEVYNQLKEEEGEIFDFSEGELNFLGYTFLRQNKYDEAIKLFQLNIDAYPESYNTYDSMGEALMNKGDKEGAIKNYKKSIELNSQNLNGYTMLKKLGVDIEKPADSKVSEEQLKKYVGEYQLFPNFNITISNNGKELFAQATGQGKFQVFPETETLFYYKVVDAKIKFTVNEDGSVNSLTLFQAGKEIPGKRIEE